jgi:GcrA cell cycle regulator
MSWTDERVELLSQLWAEGRSASQISLALGAGLTRNAVIGKVHRLGLAGRAKSSSPSSGMSGSSTPRAAVRRSAPRASVNGMGVDAAGRMAVSTAAVASNGAAARAVHGNNALVLQPATVLETAPARLEQDVVVPMSLRVTIVDLKETMCKWPLGDPSSHEFRYCGSAAPGASPYCVYHGKLAYQPAQDRRRDRDRDRRAMIAR